ncbi:hypothetical protein NLS1_16220 [Nocardioides sp. LS1]|nr:hypothetical protein NLS1_16220 [Nocardioides sp. LS1]
MTPGVAPQGQRAMPSSPVTGPLLMSPIQAQPADSLIAQLRYSGFSQPKRVPAFHSERWFP